METYREKASRKFKQQPLVPIGTLATTAALIMAMTKLRKGQSASLNRWLRVRVVAQGFTIVAVAAGSWMYGSQKGSISHQDEAAANAQEKAKEERASFEERLKVAEETHRIESQLTTGKVAREKERETEKKGETVSQIEKSGGILDEVVRARARAQSQIKAQQNAKASAPTPSEKHEQALTKTSHPWYSLSRWFSSDKGSDKSP